MNICEIRDELEEDLNGECISGYITKQEMMDCLDDFDEWAKNPKNGDSYFYGGTEYKYEVEYEFAVCESEEQREAGDIEYITPVTSSKDIEEIKKEAEAYAIESTGYIEIFVVGEDDAVAHYKNGAWNDGPAEV